MGIAYKAIYEPSAGRAYPSIVFVSPVTITIRYRDEQDREQEVYWLEKDIIAFSETTGTSVLQHRNKAGTVESLHLHDEELQAAVKKQLRHNRFVGKAHQRLFSKVWSKILLLFSLIAGLFLLAYLWFIPWLGERIAMNFSKEYEITMGEQMYRSLAASFKVDDRKTALVNRFYKQLHFQTGYPVQITVVASDQVNAFAVPGGHIVVYDAILDKMKAPEQLAALLAHEASHISGRHSLRNMFRHLARKMFLSLIAGSEPGIISVMVDNADNLKGLSYSRSLETAADNNGMRLMAVNGLDVSGMLQLMELLKKESRDREPPAFLNTHPVFSDRISNIREQMKQYPAHERAGEELSKTFQALLENNW